MAQFESVLHPMYLAEGWIPRYERWYCGHCVDTGTVGDGWTDGGAEAHVRNNHDVANPEAGYDYLSGHDLVLALKRWRKRNDQLAARAARALLDPNYTVADFLTDAGDEPWPALEGHA